MANPLQQLDSSGHHIFLTPRKEINEGQDVTSFLVSRAYRDITGFLVHLNRAMFPQKGLGEVSGSCTITVYDLDSPSVRFSEAVLSVQRLLKMVEIMVDDVPLDPGPRRFGNIAFRRWYQLLEDRASGLLQDYLPDSVISFPHSSKESALTELQPYLLGSFGSSQRLDYGTGHELSFLAFLGSIWKLGGLKFSADGNEERGVVLGILEPYLELVRKIILKYSLEPAGSHGVWGLDDHSFIPYIFGSAQYGPAVGPTDPTPTEGSHPDAPKPGNVATANLVEKERAKNMYFGAVGFIYDVKKGPFWEHSPTLYDISGVRAGWAKINKGMLKMYDAEVLSKFPVVQHFPFGSLFRWERDPDAKAPVATVHTASHPIKQIPSSPIQALSGRNQTLGTQLPWTVPNAAGSGPAGSTQAPWAVHRSVPSSGVPVASNSIAKHKTSEEQINESKGSMQPPTKASWAK